MNQPPRYLLGTGFHVSSRTPIPAHLFAEIWVNNIIRRAKPLPQQVVMVTGGTSFPIPTHPITVIHLGGDLGHIRDKHEGRKNHKYVGWTSAMLALALLAYNAELDFVYQEQDCLAFGPYIEQLYRDVGTGGMTVGRPVPHVNQPSAQALFLVRHHFIPEFVMRYMSLGEDSNRNTGERKFKKLHDDDPANVKVMSFGVDRCRPIPWDAKVWYAQQWTEEEFMQAQQRGLV